jgi:hypothetical protein
VGRPTSCLKVVVFLVEIFLLSRGFLHVGVFVGLGTPCNPPFCRCSGWMVGPSGRELLFGDPARGPYGPPDR